MNGLILVTGGTGTLGREVVRLLEVQGRTVRVLSRRPPPAEPGPADWATGDLKTGRGIDAAVAGADVIVHCATGLGDVGATRHLIESARRAGSPHLVYMSIVGVDRFPVGYYRSKLQAERLVEDSGLPWTVLRATQFHQLILRGCEALAHLPVLPVPAGTAFQPIEAGEVAARLAELATGPAAGRVPDMGGPEVRGAASLALSYLAARGRNRPVVPVRLPGAVFAGYRLGGHLAPDHAAGRVTFDEFLAGPSGSAPADHGPGRVPPSGSPRSRRGVMAKRWSDLSPGTRKTIIVLGVAEAALKAAAAIDMKRRPADQIRGPKWAWAAGLVINSAGVVPLSYFVFGRRPAP